MIEDSNYAPRASLSTAVAKPYFPGQEAQRCGHYYPDVLLFKDSLLGEKIIRTTHCFECGRFLYGEISKKSLDKNILRELENKGSKDYVADLKTLAKFRESERKRFSPGDNISVRGIKTSTYRDNSLSNL